MRLVCVPSADVGVDVVSIACTDCGAAGRSFEDELAGEDELASKLSFERVSCLPWRVERKSGLARFRRKNTTIETYAGHTESVIL